MIPKLLLFGLIWSWYISVYGQQPVFRATVQKSKPFLFMENKGQLLDENRKPLKDIFFYGWQGGVNVYLRPGMISFVFTKVENAIKQKSDVSGTFVETHCNASLPSRRTARDSASIHTARMDLIFLNSNPNPAIISSDQQEYYENFYTTGDADYGITNVRSYKTVTYQNIYPNIDLVLKANAVKGMEYSFIVNPGGDVNNIRMQWKGTDSLKLSENQTSIQYSNQLGTIKETDLKCCLAETRQAIGSKYHIAKENVIGFNIESYDHNATLIIDPSLAWDTYMGGVNYDVSHGVSTDLQGNAYIAGETRSSTGLGTSGSYQSSITGGNTDAFLSKFSSAGKISWSTYYGGKSDDQAFAIATDTSGGVFITGGTSSTGIATTGVYQTAFGGCFLARFSNTGTLAWATYYNSDGGNSICADLKGNLFITGRTSSSTGVASAGAYQDTLTGNYDAYLAKFSNTGKRIWATYFGGTSLDVANGVSADRSGNVYITGVSSSNGLASSGAFQTAHDGSGAYDVFLAKFSSSGSRLWSTYFGGEGQDEANGASTDNLGNVYITGTTYSKTGIGTSGVYKNTLTGIANAFLAKFSSAGNLDWATYYGGTYGEQGLAVSTDTTGHIYIAGETTSGDGIATCSAYQTSFTGDVNAFLAKFSNTGGRLWSTYYGGNDAAVGINADNSGNVYLTGYGGSAKAGAGAYQVSPAGDRDAFLAKFHLSLIDAGVSSISNPKPVFCPGTQNVKVQVKNYGTIEIDSITINLSINGNIQKAYHWTGKLKPDSSFFQDIGSYTFSTGNYTVISWTSKPNGIADDQPCNDTAIAKDTAFILPKSEAGGNHTICEGDKITLGKSSSPGYAYLWTSKPVGFTSALSNPEVKPNVKTVYYLTEKITGPGCINTDSAIISVNPSPTANAGTNQEYCAGDIPAVTLGGPAISGHTYTWTSKPGGFSANISNPKASPTAKTVYYLTETNSATGCGKTDSVIISFNSLPVANPGKNQSVCSGSGVTLGTIPTAGHAYQWVSKPAGFSSTVPNPVVKPMVETVYYLTETITASGCTKSDSVIIKVYPSPHPVAGKPDFICPGKKISLGYAGTPGDKYKWSSNPAGFLFTLPLATDSPSVTTRYILEETDPVTGCSNKDSTLISVNPLPVPAIQSPDMVCGGDTAITCFVNQVAGSSWTWVVKRGKIISGQGTNSISAKFDIGKDSVFVTETNATGCIGKAAKNILVKQTPDARFRMAKDSPDYKFTAIDSMEQYYKWDLGDGSTGNFYKITHQFPFAKDSFVKVSLTVGSAFGCSSTFDSVINLHYFKPTEFNIRVYPNPFVNTTRIEIALDKGAHIRILVYDALGRLITNLADVDQSAGIKSYTLDSNHPYLSQAVYFLRVVVDDKEYVREVVRQ